MFSLRRSVLSSQAQPRSGSSVSSVLAECFVFTQGPLFGKQSGSVFWDQVGFPRARSAPPLVEPWPDPKLHFFSFLHTPKLFVLRKLTPGYSNCMIIIVLEREKDVLLRHVQFKGAEIRPFRLG